jgi:hypothetical protein
LGQVIAKIREQLHVATSAVCLTSSGALELAAVTVPKQAARLAHLVKWLYQQ